MDSYGYILLCKLLCILLSIYFTLRRVQKIDEVLEDIVLHDVNLHNWRIWFYAHTSEIDYFLLSRTVVTDSTFHTH